jgi:hypothetical protein
MEAASQASSKQWIAERRNRIVQLRGDVERLVFVVGTGVSHSVAESISDASLLQWKGLLLNALQHLVSISDVDLARSIANQQATLADPKANADDYTTVSEFIRRNMQAQPTEFVKWLASRFGKGCLNVRSPTDNVHLPLHRLHARGAKLLTVNYDGLLEDTAPSDQPFKVFHRSDPHAAQEWMVSNPKLPKERGVFHLHGHWSRANDVVFGITDYAKAVHADSKLQELMKSLKHKTVIFVGCSGTLSDPNFKNTLDMWVSQTGPEGMSGHSLNWYVILREPEMVRFSKLKIPVVIPVCYGAKYEHLGNFLRQLLSGQPHYHPGNHMSADLTSHLVLTPLPLCYLCDPTRG